jgi:hypothetical protein
MKFFLGYSKLMFCKGLVISLFDDGFDREDIGTFFWNNGTKSQIKDQSKMNWDNPLSSNYLVAGIVYMP